MNSKIVFPPPLFPVGLSVTNQSEADPKDRLNYYCVNI